MSNKKQTSVEWLESLYYPSYIPKEILEQAKEIEKQQIIDAYINGKYEGDLVVMSDKYYAEKYYTETYKTKL